MDVKRDLDKKVDGVKDGGELHRTKSDRRDHDRRAEDRRSLDRRQNPRRDVDKSKAVPPNKMLLEVITPYGPVIEEFVDEVTAPGALGEFGALPGHAPYITILSTGKLLYKLNGVQQRAFINSGYAEVDAAHVSILVSSSEKVESIDHTRAQKAKERAEARLKSAKDIDIIRAESALARALFRLELSGK